MAMPRNGDMTKFAKRLRELREQQGWTRQQLAARVGVTTTTVGNWEGARCFPNVHRRPQVCEILGTTPEDLSLPPFNTP
jgi:transcriptional regulator with XRE-family HTH domain